MKAYSNYRVFQQLVPKVIVEHVHLKSNSGRVFEQDTYRPNLLAVGYVEGRTDSEALQAAKTKFGIEHPMVQEMNAPKHLRE